MDLRFQNWISHIRVGKLAFARGHLDRDPASQHEQAQRHSNNSYLPRGHVYPAGAAVGSRLLVRTRQIRT